MRVLFPIRYAEHPAVEVSDHGYAVAADVVRVGPIGLLVEVGDVLLVDGVPREVVEVEVRASRHGVPAEDVYLRHGRTERPFVKQLVRG